MMLASKIIAMAVVGAAVAIIALTNSGLTEQALTMEPAVGGAESPCGNGYSLIGDICEPTPKGYVETRSQCEMGVDSREAAGVEQDYQTELKKCRDGQQ